MKAKRKLVAIFILVALCGVLLQIQRLGYLSADVNSNMNTYSTVVMNDTPSNQIALSNMEINEDKTLIVYDPSERGYADEKARIETNLNYLKITTESIKVSDTPKYNFSKYDTVVIGFGSLEEKLGGSELNRLMRYVENGGKVYFTVALDGPSEEYYYLYKKMGIENVGTYIPTNGMKFVTDIIPGTKGRTFEGDAAFSDSILSVKLSSDCEVMVESYGSKNPGVPIMWSKKLGKGTIVMYNGTGLNSSFYGGLFAGGYSAAQGNFIYPIINAKVIYIDDFPAPQYNMEFQNITDTYGKTIKDFYRDIWWPDMQKAANKYGYKYTGLFISTYNKIVDPSLFTFEDYEYFQYYGNSLMKNGHEIGLHGYNHQSLALAGWVPEDVGYTPWDSQADMEKALKTLCDYAAELFPGTTFSTYVPPSNYLSPEGRQALANAVPDLKIISGLYFDDSPEKASYVQNFEIADDGIAEFPRVSSGVWYEDQDLQFIYLNGLGLNGVFSHFLHPDDVTDPDRGRGALWDVMLKQFESILEDVNTNYPQLRALKSVEAADAVKAYDEIKVNLEYGETSIKGACDNFYGEAFFYLRTDKTPKVKDSGVTVQKMGDGDYYFVTVSEPIFTIELE